MRCPTRLDGLVNPPTYRRWSKAPNQSCLPASLKWCRRGRFCRTNRPYWPKSKTRIQMLFFWGRSDVVLFVLLAHTSLCPAKWNWISSLLLDSWVACKLRVAGCCFPLIFLALPVMWGTCLWRATQENCCGKHAGHKHAFLLLAGFLSVWSRSVKITELPGVAITCATLV